MGSDRSAAVVGAGIGGLAAAIALTRAGWEVSVFEANAEHRELGAGLSLWPNALRALRALGLGEELRAHGIEQGGGIRRADGSMLAGFRPGAVERRFGDPIVGLLRTDLHAALLSACDPGRVRLSARVTRLEEGELSFADGTSAGADLVVGADGLRSTVRAALLGDGEPRDPGILAYRGTSTWEGELPAGEWWGEHSIAGLLPLGDGRVYWYLGCRGEDRPGRLAELCEDFVPVIGEVASRTPAEEILVHPLHDRDPVGSWTRGAATLLGDAAHPMLPFIGQGACAALEDAVVLGRELSAREDLGAALAAYERARTERTALLVKTSRRAAAMALPRSALARRLRNAILPLVPESARLRQFQPLLSWTPDG